MERKASSSSTGVSVKGVGDVWIKLARCCMPVPGDNIIGFITRNQGVSVHRTDCQNMIDLKNKQPERVVEVEWTSTKGLFMVKIQVEALDRRNLLSDVTRVLSDHGVNIISGTSPPVPIAWPPASSASKWPIRSISTRCWQPCARLMACSTCTASLVPRNPPNLDCAR